MEADTHKIFRMFTLEQVSSDTVSIVYKIDCQVEPKLAVMIVKVLDISDGSQKEEQHFLNNDKKPLSSSIDEIEIETKFRPGRRYRVEALIIIVGHGRNMFDKEVKSFTKIYDHTSLQNLMAKAIKFKQDGAVFRKLDYFTRDKPAVYFVHIDEFRRGIMEVYMKDQNGDQGSPINGKLLGLFFSASSRPLPESHFGDTRFLVPWTLILNEGTNLYFADFYCINSAHYVTLVVTRKDTEADEFCKKFLLKLDLRDNKFLKISNSAGNGLQRTLWVSEMWGCHVELFYTENIHLAEFVKTGAAFYQVPFTGTSRPGGLRKNPKCPICNLRNKKK